MLADDTHSPCSPVLFAAGGAARAGRRRSNVLHVWSTVLLTRPAAPREGATRLCRVAARCDTNSLPALSGFRVDFADIRQGKDASW